VTATNRLHAGQLYQAMARGQATLMPKDANPSNKKEARKFLQAVAQGTWMGKRYLFQCYFNVVS
jgi:hypothetical protein